MFGIMSDTSENTTSTDSSVKQDNTESSHESRITRETRARPKTMLAIVGSTSSILAAGITATAFLWNSENNQENLSTIFEGVTAEKYTLGDNDYLVLSNGTVIHEDSCPRYIPSPETNSFKSGQNSGTSSDVTINLEGNIEALQEHDKEGFEAFIAQQESMINCWASQTNSGTSQDISLEAE